MSETHDYRLAEEDRWIGGRIEPGKIEVRTRFLYSDPTAPGIYPKGRHTHAFARGGYVTVSDWASSDIHANDPDDHLRRAIASFGDDADLVITVALRAPLSGTPTEA